MHSASTLWTSRLAAFLAVALLSFAGVKSAVMQVRMVGPSGVDCGMAGMASTPEPAMHMAEMSADHHAADAAKGAKPAATDPCPFCMDAAHAPLIALAAPLHPPVSAVFVVAVARPPLGARAPPAFEPRARGPPSRLQTA